MSEKEDMIVKLVSNIKKILNDLDSMAGQVIFCTAKAGKDELEEKVKKQFLLIGKAKKIAQQLSERSASRVSLIEDLEKIYRYVKSALDILDELLADLVLIPQGELEALLDKIDARANYGEILSEITLPQYLEASGAILGAILTVRAVIVLLVAINTLITS